MSDPVNHPSHYTRGGIECIDVIEALDLGYHLGNALKYLYRAGAKDGNPARRDIEKAAWYLQRWLQTDTDKKARTSEQTPTVKAPL